MKMICDVPDEVIKCIKDGTWCGSSVAEKMIANGIPLSSSEEPCEDAISRQAAIDAITKTSGIRADALKALYDVPPVTPQPKTGWIPVSERLPKENKTVIASTKYGVYPEAKYTKEYGWEWAYEAGADYWRELKDVMAWMPLPEPYKAEGSEAE